MYIPKSRKGWSPLTRVVLSTRMGRSGFEKKPKTRSGWWLMRQEWLIEAVGNGRVDKAHHRVEALRAAKREYDSGAFVHWNQSMLPTKLLELQPQRDPHMQSLMPKLLRGCFSGRAYRRQLGSLKQPCASGHGRDTRSAVNNTKHLRNY